MKIELKHSSNYNHGHWTFGDNNGHGLYMVCSNCGFMWADKERTCTEMLKIFQYCPSCGATMVKDE